MIYNPAALARIRRLEVRGGLAQIRIENTTTYERGRYPGFTSIRSTGQRDLNKTHLDGLSVAIPAPTYRGSLVAAFGVHRVKNFDRAFRQELIDEKSAEEYIDENIVETESGGIWAWTGGVASEISPKMAVGAALLVYTGTAEYGSEYFKQWNYYAPDVGDTVYGEISEFDAVSSDHIGVSGTFGLTYQASPNLNIGAVIETPSFWNVKETSTAEGYEFYDTVMAESSWEWTIDDPRSIEYNMRHPFSFGLGFGYSYEQLNLALDLKYTDWSEFEYTDGFSQDLNSVIQDNYGEALELRVGAEYILPGPGVSLRAGFFRDPLPFPSEYVDQDRQYFTFGVGFLVDRVMTVDLAAVIGGYTLQYLDPRPYTEEYKTRRVFLTFGYRM